jgi:hypothetical protein
MRLSPDDLKAELASRLQRAMVSSLTYTLSEETAQALFEDCEQIAGTVEKLILHHIDDAIAGLQANGYIPI